MVNNFAGGHCIKRHHCRQMDYHGELALTNLSTGRTLSWTCRGNRRGRSFFHGEERSLKRLAFEAVNTPLVIRFLRRMRRKIPTEPFASFPGKTTRRYGRRNESGDTMASPIFVVSLSSVFHHPGE
jgi:hypothetical protein